MNEGELKNSDENELARMIRHAIGAGDYEKVMVKTPIFNRTDGKVIKIFPTSASDLDNLKKAPDHVLKMIGLQQWEKGHWLYPVEWYDHIPNGYIVTAISGEDEPFEHGKTDDDRRCGALPYGFKKP